MRQFDIEVYPRSRVSRDKLIREIGSFTKVYKTNHSPVDTSVETLVDKLKSGRFEDALSMIDGSNHYLQPEPLEKREEKRKWATETFSDFELSWLLNISVNIALIGLYDDMPEKNDSILFRELVDKKDSMFYGAVDHRLMPLLNNGRLWESLPGIYPKDEPDCSILIVEDVLLNHFDDLDVGYVSKGFSDLRQRGESDVKVKLGMLSDEAVERYAQFLDKVHAEYGSDLHLFQDGVTGYLIRPFIDAVLGSYFRAEKRFGIRTPNDLVKKVIERPFVASYLAESFS
jgi:hypothetical protein